MIEILLKSELSDIRITALITKDLGNIPNIHLLHAPEGTKPPYIEYQVLSGRGSIYSEGELDSSVAEVQIDVYTYGSYINIRDKVIEIMKEKGYIYPQVGGFGAVYEADTKLYHCILRLEKEY